MSIEDFYQTTVSVQKAGAETIHGGTDDSGAAVNINCRVEQGNRLQANPNGNELRFDALLIMASDANIGLEDLVTLDGEKMIVLEIGKERDGGGDIHHLEVKVAKA